jgi:hypothetical protein
MTTNSNNIIYNYTDRVNTTNYQLNYINIERNIDINFNSYITNNVINNLINNYLYQDIIINDNKTREITFTTDPKYVGEICSICVECIENVETMAVTRCSHKPHVFHKACISKWTEKSHKCPNCRQDMT